LKWILVILHNSNMHMVSLQKLPCHLLL
jgi:hypothetical protein